MKTHPIKPADYFYNNQIKLENKEYTDLRRKFKENDEKALRETGNRRSAVDRQIKICEQNNVSSVANCPSWSRLVKVNKVLGEHYFTNNKSRKHNIK